MTHLDILKQFYDTIWIKGDVTAIGGFFAPQTEANGFLADMALDPTDFETLVPTVMALVREPEITILRSVEQGDWLSTLVQVQCKSRMTGEPVTLGGQLMVRFEGDKMVEAYNNFDFSGFFQQLGLLPDNMIEKALSGAMAA